MLINLKATTLGIAAVIIGSFFLGAIGIFVRFADNTIEPMTQSFARIFFAFLLITLFNLATGRLKNQTFNLHRKDIPLFLLNGLIGFSAMAALFTLSVIHTNIATTYFLLYTAPVWVVVLSWFLFKDRLTQPIFISIFLSLIGLLFLFNPTSITSNLTGNIYGLLTGLCFGIYFIITGHLGKTYHSTTITFWAQTIGALGLFPLIFIFDQTVNFHHSLQNWLPVMGAGVVVFLGYILLNYGLVKIKATAGSLLSLFEPVSALIYGLILFSEIPTPHMLIGSILIITSTITLTHSPNLKS